MLLFSGVFYGFAQAGETDKTREDGVQNKFGVLEFLHWDHPWNSYKYSTAEDLQVALGLIKEAGIGWVRMDFLWSDIEPECNVFDFAKYDRIVNMLFENNIKVLGILNYSTDWASSCGKWNCPPKDSKIFVDYCVKVIRRYKDKIKHWEVWNEPDSPTYWQPQDGLKVYCRLLKEVYIAAKKEDPECVILNGGISAGLGSVDRLYENGAKDYFDIMNIHIFDDPLRLDAISTVSAYPKLVYKAMSRNGDGQKKIWVTEIGCPGVKNGSRVENWWMGNNPQEEEQARWVTDVYTKLLGDKNIEVVFWAFLRDCKGHWGNGIDYFGLVRWDFSRKPAFFSYKKIAHEQIKDIH